MNKHFTFADRVKIQYLIENRPRCSASFLAEELNKSRAAIYYELKHNSTKLKSPHSSFYKQTDLFVCSSLNRFPFCCNSCPKSRCSHKSILYNAHDANDFAYKKLTHSRIDTAHRRSIIDIIDQRISPLILNGQSIDIALRTSGITDISESTIRRYIEKNLVLAKRIDLPNAVRFKVQKQYFSKPSKINPRILYNRTYDDFLKYIEDHPKAIVVQLDSVIGKANDKFALLTVYFMNSKFQFAFKYKRKNSNINKILLHLYNTSLECGYKLFDVLLTDNGGEFHKLIDLEYDEENLPRCKVFYCDPYRSYQKAECERNHGLIRRIIKKGKSLDQISQEEFDMAMSHINSYPRGSLEYRTPYTLFSKEYTSIILDIFNIMKIDSKNIKLK